MSKDTDSSSNEPLQPEFSPKPSQTGPQSFLAGDDEPNTPEPETPDPSGTPDQ